MRRKKKGLKWFLCDSYIFGVSYPFSTDINCSSQNADGSMPKVSVSKAKSDVPATNHSNKSVAEPPNGEPDVNSQPKNDAKVQTNELVVEKNEEGENCLFEHGL